MDHLICLYILQFSENSKGEYEVGVAYICGENFDCSCTALYQSQECSFCVICGALGEITSFSGDCQNVAGYTNNCMVDCGFEPQGCFPDPTEPPEVTEPPTAVVAATDPPVSTDEVSESGASTTIATLTGATSFALFCLVCLNAM